MVEFILNFILIIVCIIYLIKYHTWYQVAFLGIIGISMGLMEQFTSWELDFMSYAFGVLALFALNIKITIEK